MYDIQFSWPTHHHCDKKAGVKSLTFKIASLVYEGLICWILESQFVYILSWTRKIVCIQMLREALILRQLIWVEYFNSFISALLMWCHWLMLTKYVKRNGIHAKQESVNNSNGKDDSFVLRFLPLNTNDDILSDSFLTFERQIKWDEGFVSKLLNRKSAATSAFSTPLNSPN